MDSKIKKLVAGVALAGALTVGTAGVAVAADGNGGTATDPSAQTRPAAPGPAGRDPQGRGQGRHRHARRQPPGAPGRPAGRPDHQRRTPPRWARTPRPWSTRLTNAATTKLDQLVADGTITQERADTVKSKLPARIDKLMNRQFGQHASA